MNLAQIDAKTVTDILSIESVSVIGILLIVIACLIWYVRRLLNENKELQGHIMGFAEKWYVMSTKIYDFIERKRDV